MEPIIQVEGLKKYFGAVKAVDDISFQVERGELFGFLGINGAGKSTTINMLCTVLKPTAGQAEICGFKVGKENEEIRRRIGVVYQNNCLDERLTVKENLFIRGALYEKNSRKLSENISRICEILELESAYGRKFKMLSGGQKRRCEIARALVNRPEIIFADEPTGNLDSKTSDEVIALLKMTAKKYGQTIVMITHDDEIAQVADRILVIEDGQVVDFR